MPNQSSIQPLNYGISDWIGLVDRIQSSGRNKARIENSGTAGQAKHAAIAADRKNLTVEVIRSISPRERDVLTRFYLKDSPNSKSAAKWE